MYYGSCPGAWLLTTQSDLPGGILHTKITLCACQLVTSLPGEVLVRPSDTLVVNERQHVANHASVRLHLRDPGKAGIVVLSPWEIQTYEFPLKRVPPHADFPDRPLRQSKPFFQSCRGRRQIPSNFYPRLPIAVPVLHHCHTRRIDLHKCTTPQSNGA